MRPVSEEPKPKKDVKNGCGPERGKKVFDQLKIITLLMFWPILDIQEPFQFHKNPSSPGLGAVLYQNHEWGKKKV